MTTLMMTQTSDIRELKLDAHKTSVRLDKLEDKMDKLEDKVDKLDDKVDRLADKVDRLADKVEELSDSMKNMSTVVTQLFTNGEKLTKNGIRQFMNRVSQSQELITTSYIKNAMIKGMPTLRVQNVMINDWPDRFDENKKVTNLDGAFILTIKIQVVNRASSERHEETEFEYTDGSFCVVEAKNDVTIAKVMKKMQQVSIIWKDITDVQGTKSIIQPMSTPKWRSMMDKNQFENHHMTGVILCFAANTGNNQVLHFIKEIHGGTYIKRRNGQVLYESDIKGNMHKPPKYEEINPILEMFRGRIFAFMGTPEHAALEPSPNHVKLFTKDILPDSRDKEIYKEIASNISKHAKDFYKHHEEKRMLLKFTGGPVQ
jgi:uncharacterized protein YoxC